ncbi:MAG: NTP transferase domain-containing protein [Candidatus Microthrix subdominans]
MADRCAALAHLIVVAGGGGERLGGVDKALSVVGGRQLIDHALGVAVTGRCLVVRPSDRHAIGRVAGLSTVESVAERPAGGGPAAGIAAALNALGRPRDGHAGGEPAETNAGALVAVLAADHLAPLDAVVAELVEALQRHPESGVAVAAPAGEPQWLTAVWRFSTLIEAVDALGTADGASARALTNHGTPLLVEVPRVVSLDDAEDLWAAVADGSPALGVAGPMPARSRVVDALSGAGGVGGVGDTVDPDGHAATLLGVVEAVPPPSEWTTVRPAIPWVFVGPPAPPAAHWAGAHLVPLER